MCSCDRCPFCSMHMAAVQLFSTAYHFPEPLSMTWATARCDPLPRIVRRSYRLSALNTSWSMLTCRNTNICSTVQAINKRREDEGGETRDEARTHHAHDLVRSASPNDISDALRRHFVLSFPVLTGASLILTHEVEYGMFSVSILTQRCH